MEERKYAWDVTSNIIFVDSPINVGYSYSDDPRDRVYNESVLAADLLDFLEEFLDGAAFVRRFQLQLGSVHRPGLADITRWLWSHTSAFALPCSLGWVVGTWLSLSVGTSSMAGRLSWRACLRGPPHLQCTAAAKFTLSCICRARRLC